MTYSVVMATKREELLRRLALANKSRAAAKAQGAKMEKVAPKPATEALDREVPADGQRELADATAKDAMVMGWDQAIQKHAYENRIPEQELRRLLDQALEYNDKADPSGRIDELEDWKIQRRGRSALAPQRR